MTQLKLKMNQLVLKRDDGNLLKAYVEATIEIDNKIFDITYSEGILAYENTVDGKRVTIANSTQKSIKAVLQVFVAGLEMKSSFIVSLSTDECDTPKCKLED